MKQQLLLGRATDGTWEIHQRVDGKTVGFISLGRQDEESGVLNSAAALVDQFNWQHEADDD